MRVVCQRHQRLPGEVKVSRATPDGLATADYALLAMQDALNGPTRPITRSEALDLLIYGGSGWSFSQKVADPTNLEQEDMLENARE